MFVVGIFDACVAVDDVFVAVLDAEAGKTGHCGEHQVWQV